MPARSGAAAGAAVVNGATAPASARGGPEACFDSADPLRRYNQNRGRRRNDGRYGDLVPSRAAMAAGNAGTLAPRSHRTFPQIDASVVGLPELATT